MKRRPVPALKQPGEPQPGQLDAAEVLTRQNLRKLPADNPNQKLALEMADSDRLAEYTELLDKSGYLSRIERRLHPKRGAQSSLPVRAFLSGALYVGAELDTYWRTRLNAFFAALNAQDAVDLGIQSLDERRDPTSYTVTCKQGTRIEQALWDGWTDPVDGTKCDIQGFGESLIHATLPEDIRWCANSVALDTTDYQSWYIQRLSLKKVDSVTADDIAELNKPVRPRKGTKRRQFNKTDGLIGQRRRDGKTIISKAPGAGVGYRSASSGHEEGIFCGNYLTIAVTVKSRRVTRSSKKAKFGSELPAFVVGFNYCAAGTSAAVTGRDTIASAERCCDHVDDIVADIGFSQLLPSFNRAVHNEDRHLTMDMKAIHLKSAKPVQLGASGYPAFVHGGTILHAYTPKKYRVPSKGLNDKQLEDFYCEREKFALTVNQHLPNGAKQFESPTHTGSLYINASQQPKSASQTYYGKPSDFDKHFKDISPQVVFQRYITVTADDLDEYQQPHFGTTAQRQSYGRRLQSENAFAQLKSGGGLNNKTCRVVNDGARYLAALARVLQYNLRLRSEYDEETMAAKRARRAADKAQPKRYIPQRFVAPDTATAAEPGIDSPEIAEPRAPP